MGKTLHYGEFKFDKSPAKPTTQGYKSGGKVGLWDNIHAKRERIEGGSGERMRKPGSKGAPTKQDFKDAASKMKEGGSADMAQDKAMVKKAIKQHDAQQHAGSKGTDLKLKKGGNVKMVGMKREPEAIVKKEIALLKKAGAPAKIIKHEEREMVKPMMKKGGKVKKYAEGGPTAKGPMTEGERQKMKMQMAKEAEMDRKMRQAQKDMPTNQRMLDDAMNPLSALKEAYERVTDRSGQSATENMKRYGMKKGGVPTHNRSPKIC